MAEVDICFLSVGGPVHDKSNNSVWAESFLDIPSIFFSTNGDGDVAWKLFVQCLKLEHQLFIVAVELNF